MKWYCGWQCMKIVRRIFLLKYFVLWYEWDPKLWTHFTKKTVDWLHEAFPIMIKHCIGSEKMRARSMEKVGVWWKAAKSCFVRGTRRGDTWRGGDSLRYGGKYQYCTHPSLSQPSSGLLLKAWWGSSSKLFGRYFPFSAIKCKPKFRFS